MLSMVRLRNKKMFRDRTGPNRPCSGPEQDQVLFWYDHYAKYWRPKTNVYMKRRMQQETGRQTESHFSHSILPHTMVKLTTQYASKFIPDTSDTFNFQSIHHAPQSISPHSSQETKIL